MNNPPTNEPKMPEVIASKAAWRIAEHYKDGIKYEVGKENLQYAHQFITDQIKLAIGESTAVLERELGEAKLECDNLQQRCNALKDNPLDGASSLLEKNTKLQQELSQLRGELEKYILPSNNPLTDIPLNRQIQILNKQLVDSEQQCDFLAKQLEGMVNGHAQDQEYIEQLAKQKHKMREALIEVHHVMRNMPDHDLVDSPNDSTWAPVSWKAMRIVRAALKQPDTTSLLVLTRAEVEKLPCHCSGPENHFTDKTGTYAPHEYFTKCSRCQLLERFEK